MCGVTKNGKIEITQEELVEMVERLMDEREAKRIAAGGNRAPMSKFVDPDGKTLISSTLRKAQLVQVLVGLVLGIGAILGAMNFFYNEMSVKPAAKREAVLLLGEHEKRVEKMMAEVRPTLVTRAEFQAYADRREERWAAQQQTNVRIETGLTEMQRDIKELLKRVR